MTEKERLDQIEPVIADMARKQDRMLGRMMMLTDQIALHTILLQDLKKEVDTLAKEASQITKNLTTLSSDGGQQFDQLDTKFDILIDLVKSRLK